MMQNKKTVELICVIYIFILLIMSIPIREYFMGGLFTYSNISIIEYFKYNINIFPFRTICNYIDMYVKGNVNVEYVIYNTLGNIVLFMPVGILLKLRDLTVIRIVFISMICALLMETLQIVTKCGSFDIDAVILRVGGAIIGFIITICFAYIIRRCIACVKNQ